MPVECLGMTFENEDILALSDPPYYTARPVKSGVYFTGAIFAMSLLLYAPCPLLYALCPFPLLYALYFLLFTLCAMHYALCALRHACYSTGVQRFFEQVSYKAPLTHIEGGAFFLFLPRGIKSIFPRGHPMGRGVREYKGGSRFALIYMN